MNKDEIYIKLREKSQLKRLPVPKNIELYSCDGVLNITMCNILGGDNKNGITGNMQENGTAFEAYSIIIKSYLPEIAQKIIISWKGVPKIEKRYDHYIRFIYRAFHFAESYAWVTLNPIDQLAKDDLEEFKQELPFWIINAPTKEAEVIAHKPEAKLERLLLKQLKGEYGQQFPMGLFYKIKSEKSRRTPGRNSGIDLWTLYDNIFSIYELKIDNNKKVGIISELMFYVNVIKDIVDYKINFVKGADKINFRNYQIFYNSVISNNINRVKGVFLANFFHPLISKNKEAILEILNQNKRNLEYSHLKIDSNFNY